MSVESARCCYELTPRNPPDGLSYWPIGFLVLFIVLFLRGNFLFSSLVFCHFLLFSPLVLVVCFHVVWKYYKIMIDSYSIVAIHFKAERSVLVIFISCPLVAIAQLASSQMPRCMLELTFWYACYNLLSSVFRLLLLLGSITCPTLYFCNDIGLPQDCWIWRLISFMGHY